MHIYGTGSNERKWIHVEDHCLALLKILKKGKIGVNYNIRTGHVLKNINIAKKILKKIIKIRL